MRPSHLFALICFFFFGFISTSYADKQEDLEKLRQRIASLQQEMERNSDTKTETADALRESERAISNSNRILHRLNEQQQEANKTLDEFQKQSRAINAEMHEQNQLLSKLLYQQYLGGKQEYFRLLLNNHDPNQAARELQYYEYIAQSRADWLKNMRNNLSKLSTVASQAKQKNDELAALRAEQSAQKESLLKEKSTHQQVLKRISLQLKQQRREIGRLQRDEKHLSKLLEKLSHIVAQPKQSQTNSKNSTRLHNPSSLSFSAIKGKLPLPVKGTITNQFGSKRPDSTLLWKGLFLRAPASQSVKAIASGQVIYADWLRGFGNLLIIDHGDGYMSLYGNNEVLYKQVGDQLKAGDMIAAVGNSGGNENYGLYFELRHEGIPLDPSKWLSGRFN